MSEPTLLSLFDGSGGFPLAASLCGIRPIAASEIEPYPIAVTRSRFPNMEHLGSVTEIHGGKIKPVDVITFGAPCQDLSVAGKRAGLRHGDLGDEETTRSGLFMEAVRIIKEMREATNGEYPKYCIYENVPGAFSSSKGEDWRIVLEELIKIVEPGAVMPPVPKNGWAYADSYCGEGWSLAYRVLDAQHWGVPQRRRRVFLTLDLTGNRARAVCFEREGVRGHFETFRTAGQETARDAVDCSETADCETVGGVTAAAGFKANQGPKAGNIGLESERACTLNADRPGLEPTVCAQYLFENHSQDSRYRGPLDVCPMLPAQLGTGGNNQPFVVSIQGNTIDRNAKQNGSGICENVAHTLNAVDRHAVAYSIGNGQLNQISMSEVCNTLDCMHDKQAVLIEETPIALDRAFYNQGQNALYEPQYYDDGTCPTLVAKGSGAVCVQYVVRRLTPTECARLQGFPDDWGIPDPKEDFTDEEYAFWLNVRNTHAAINGKTVKDYAKPAMVKWYNKLHTDSSEYKMWGNGIALPCAVYIMQGIADALNDE